jgi:hypothetical protein
VVAAAVIGLTPGCGAEGPVDTADQDASSLDASRSQDGTVDPVDALIADVEADVTQSSDDVPTASDAGQASDAAGPTDDAELFDVAEDTASSDGASEDTASSDGASEDTASSDDATEDITAIADTTSGSDADEPFDVEPSQDMSGPSEDASESDTTEECIAYCWQPIEQACEAPEDCDREATEGTCSDSGDACIYDFECGQDATCEGAIQAASAYVDDDGKVSPSSQLNCIDGFCHEGDMINDDAMACCSGQMGQATPGVLLHRPSSTVRASLSEQSVSSPEVVKPAVRPRNTPWEAVTPPLHSAPHEGVEFVVGRWLLARVERVCRWDHGVRAMGQPVVE